MNTNDHTKMFLCIEKDAEAIDHTHIEIYFADGSLFRRYEIPKIHRGQRDYAWAVNTFEAVQKNTKGIENWEFLKLEE